MLGMIPMHQKNSSCLKCQKTTFAYSSVHNNRKSSKLHTSEIFVLAQMQKVARHLLTVIISRINVINIIKFNQLFSLDQEAHEQKRDLATDSKQKS